MLRTNRPLVSLFILASLFICVFFFLKVSEDRLKGYDSISHEARQQLQLEQVQRLLEERRKRPDTLDVQEQLEEELHWQWMQGQAAGRRTEQLQAQTQPLPVALAYTQRLLVCFSKLFSLLIFFFPSKGGCGPHAQRHGQCAPTDEQTAGGT